MADNLGSEFQIKKNSFTDLNWVYLQWCLHTGLYMLEPWERGMFNSAVLLTVGLIAAVFVSVVPL